jgi:hypothetical protein
MWGPWVGREDDRSYNATVDKSEQVIMSLRETKIVHVRLNNKR